MLPVSIGLSLPRTGAVSPSTASDGDRCISIDALDGFIVEIFLCDALGSEMGLVIDHECYYAVDDCCESDDSLNMCAVISIVIINFFLRDLSWVTLGKGACRVIS